MCHDYDNERNNCPGSKLIPQVICYLSVFKTQLSIAHFYSVMCFFFTCQTTMFCRPLLQNKLLVVGVEYMNDDLAEMDVPYGRVYDKDRSNILQDIADGTVNYFSDKGLYCSVHSCK